MEPAPELGDLPGATAEALREAIEPGEAITHIVPARYFLVALRSIVLKGAGITAFWQDMAALALFATVALGLASLRLRKEWA